MPRVRDAMDVLEQIAPKRFAFSFDKVGLQVGDPNTELTTGVVSLDRSLGAVRFAAAQGAQMVVAHHPLIFEPLSSVLETSHVGRTVLELARNGIAFAAAHTNWDSAIGGINDALAARLGLTDVVAFGEAAQVNNLKLVVFTPAGDAQKVIDAASEAGAGVIGEYSRCAFMSHGTGTFRGSERSNPAVGQAGQVEQAEEIRIEMILPEGRARAVSRAICRVHSYEEPALDFLALASNAEQPAGRVGKLSEGMPLAQFVSLANEKLGAAPWAWGDPSRPIRKVAVVGGSADIEWRNARGAGADVLLTGEVKQHVGLEVAEEGFAIVASGHYATEQPGCEVLRDRLAAALSDVEWLLFAPEPGFSGRPFARTSSGILG